MKQKTISKTIRAAGLGLHSGVRVHALIRPAPVNHGIRFVRSDLNGRPEIKLGEAHVHDTLLCTGIEQSGARVRTVEHILAAISALEIDNIIIEVDAEEIPILDGSSAPWVHLFLEAGITQQSEIRKVYKLKAPHEIRKGESWIKARPSNNFYRQVHIEFAHPSIEKTPVSAFTDGSPSDFIHRIARARTFGFLHQVEQMHANGLAKGGSLENAMVLDEYHLINHDGMRMPDEFAQHKLLDLMGDLMILGAPLMA